MATTHRAPSADPVSPHRIRTVRSIHRSKACRRAARRPGHFPDRLPARQRLETADRLSGQWRPDAAVDPGTALGLGTAVLYLSLMVFHPVGRGGTPPPKADRIRSGTRSLRRTRGPRSNSRSSVRSWSRSSTSSWVRSSPGCSSATGSPAWRSWTSSSTCHSRCRRSWPDSYCSRSTERRARCTSTWPIPVSPSSSPCCS